MHGETARFIDGLNRDKGAKGPNYQPDKRLVQSTKGVTIVSVCNTGVETQKA